MSPVRLRAPVGDGELLGLPPEYDPGNGLVNHTLRHWLSTRRELDEVRFTQALRAKAWPAERCREAVVGSRAMDWAALEEIPHDPTRIQSEPRWWRDKVRAAVHEAHDRGYWLAYLSLVRRAGLPGQFAVGGWRCTVRRRWQLDTEEGYVVAGDLGGDGRQLATVTAHRSVVRLADNAPPAPPDDLFMAELARLRRRGR